MVTMADGYIALPGGIGTLYEISEILALKRAFEIEHHKPLILIDKYYENLRKLFIEMVKDGFTHESLHSLFDIAQTPQKAVSLLRKKLRG